MTRWIIATLGVLAVRAAQAAPIVVDKAPPGTGCFARSATGDTIACVIGMQGMNVGGSNETLVFARAAGDPPEAIPLFDETGETSNGPDVLPAPVLAAMTTALHGYVKLEAAAPKLEFRDGKTDPSVIKLGKLQIGLRGASAKQQGFAPAYRTVLTVTRAGHKPEILDDRTDSTSGVTVEAYPLGTAVVVEMSASVADEGAYGTRTVVWLCTAAMCTPQ